MLIKFGLRMKNIREIGTQKYVKDFEQEYEM